jgi:hypothetical protein
MKFKSILLTAIVTISLATATMAQVPNYVPTNGLVGWWPFNGNANDESGNGNNGTINGATLTEDRLGNTNKAYSFDGVNDQMEILNQNNSTNLTISIWLSINSYGSAIQSLDFSTIIMKSNHWASVNGYSMLLNRDINNVNSRGIYLYIAGSAPYIFPFNWQINQWYHLVLTINNGNAELYINNNLINSYSNVAAIPQNNGNLVLANGNTQVPASYLFPGKLDDIGIWNLALTQQEISDLFNAVNCTNSTTITPQTNSITTGNTVTFTASTSDSNPSYVWQSDLGQGFQTLNNFGNYTGVNTATLNVANVQLPNHTQPIRVISTSGNCIDTSNVAVINILDTCITNVTIYDTLLTTVTDTLVINAVITGINPPNNLNTLKVFPNPASTHITIDYGNFNSMSGYTLNIVNFVGQTVFTTPINQQTSYIDLSTWTGNGIYFVQLIDPQNNSIENRKIVIQ